jgi:hypothetical protein
MKPVCALLLFAAGLLAGPGRTASGQSFSFAPQQIMLSDTVGAEMVFNATCTNLSQIPLTLTFIRSVNVLPDQWESSMCLEACYQSTVDTISTTSEYGSSPLSPGEVRAFSLHVYALTNPGTGEVRIRVLDRRNPVDSTAVLFTSTATTSSVGDEPDVAAALHLDQNYPNPFNGETVIGYTIRPDGGNSPGGGSGNEEWVILKVYDMRGGEVLTLANGRQIPGAYTLRVDGTGLATGTYIYRLQSGAGSLSRKFMLLR